ncbi:MAG: hypothetical protein WD598_12435 [Acidimicrobiia bacterium]
MAHSNGRVAPSTSARFPAEIVKWIAMNGELINALIALRRMGAEADAAVEAVGEIPGLLRFRLSLELWMALAEGDGADPERLMLEHLPLDLFDRLRLALWGAPTPGGDADWLRAVGRP